jgi:predicted nucleotidyltransferase
MAPALHEILQEFRHGLECIYGSRLAGLILFGSQARGDARGMPFRIRISTY